MLRDVNPIILKGNYDTLEHKLAGYFGIRVILIRDWKDPERALFNEEGSDTREGERLRKAVDAWHRANPQHSFASWDVPVVVEARNKSLRAYLISRDYEMASITDAELRSIQKVGHVTLRANNASPPHTVIVYDDTNHKTPAGRFDYMFGCIRDFHNVNHPKQDRKNRLPLMSFASSWDVAPHEIRAYEAIRKTIYALQNQHQFDNRDKGNYWSPAFYTRARIEENSSSGFGPRNSIWELGSVLGYTALCQMLDHDWQLIMSAYSQDGKGNPFGFSQDFFERLRLARAVKGIHYRHSEDYETIARIKAHRAGTGRRQDELDMGEIQRLRQFMKENIERGCKATLPQDMGWEEHGKHFAWCFVDDDIRISIPVFREFYKIGVWTDSERAYLDTLWKGCDRYFPEIAASPIPQLKVGSILPRTATEYRTAASSERAQKPGMP
jgi:PHD/YefM family antitoxin component YafN of YafNO toxin-antitoxin module